MPLPSRAARPLRALAATAVLVVLGAAVAADGVRRGFAMPNGGYSIGSHDQQVGDEVMYAVPPFENVTDRPITLRAIRLLTIPEGWTVLGYGSLGIAETNGMMLGWNERWVDPSDDPRPLLRPIAGVVVPPHQYSDRYGLVWARISARPAGDLETVEIVYSSGGSTFYEQYPVRYSVELAG